MNDTSRDLETVPILVRTIPECGHPTEPEEKREGFRQHGKFPLPWGHSNVELDDESLHLKDLQASFDKIQRQVESIMEAQATSSHGFGITEVTAKLGISAKGGLAFIAEAGIEASIEVKFVSRG
ncbi:CU044_2847 family protein [Streptomyces sp. NPDC005262]|uniref:CU044_2847 family protein n=1 Tax=Streptomyces sp. NPDC005262 TaxID=3364710 RepID=UPI003692D55E